MTSIRTGKYNAGRTHQRNQVFALRHQTPGIQVGTSIALLSKTSGTVQSATTVVRYRRTSTMRGPIERRRGAAATVLALPKLIQATQHWIPTCSWACLSSQWRSATVGTIGRCCPICSRPRFPGVHTGRDRFLVDIDLDRLKERVRDYFSPELSHEEIARLYPAAMMKLTRIQNIRCAQSVRGALLARGGPNEAGFVPTLISSISTTAGSIGKADRRLLTAPSPDYWAHVFEGNVWLSSAQHLRKGACQNHKHVSARRVGSFHLIERGVSDVPSMAP